MKSFIMMSLVAAVLIFSACNNSTPNEGATKSMDTTKTQAQTTSNPEPPTTASMNEVLSSYLQLKNALANDNGKDAASSANSVAEALKKIDKAALPADQKKVYEDVADDMKENAEHIGANADKIAHQREHFEMLSRDMYDLMKVAKSDKTLYKDFCPMYNDGKGAAWLSETKEIKNPYLGKKMPTCGSVKEEIK